MYMYVQGSQISHHNLQQPKKLSSDRTVPVERHAFSEYMYEILAAALSRRIHAGKTFERRSALKKHTSIMVHKIRRTFEHRQMRQHLRTATSATRSAATSE